MFKVSVHEVQETEDELAESIVRRRQEETNNWTRTKVASFSHNPG